MTKEELFELWAPTGGRWSPWVKPVLFACSPEEPVLASPPAPFFDLSELPSIAEQTALVLDLPGPDGVQLGLALAAQGYRPVPLYNAIPGPTLPTPVPQTQNFSALVNVNAIVDALRSAAPHLRTLNLSDESPPAFLLDANRRGEGQAASPGRFDNRSVSFTTDFPSATFLRAHNLQRVVLVQSGRDTPQPDLAHTLRRWQEGGLQVALKRLDYPGTPIPIEIQKPSAFGLLCQRALAALGLRRHGLGGFGGFIPTPSAG
jgi:hypothetical protein